MVGEALACGSHSGFSVFLTAPCAQLSAEKAKHASRQETEKTQTRALEMDQALPPPPPHRRHGLLTPDGPRETPPHPLRECRRRWELGRRLGGTAPARTTARMRRHACHFCPDGLALLTHCCHNIQRKRKQKPNCFVMNIFCNSRGPTIHVACGDYSFFNCYFAFALLCVLHLFSCVCTLCEGCRHDRSLPPYVHAEEPCVPLLFVFPLFLSVCWCCGRAVCVCVCVPATVDWSVCRAWCAVYGACLAAALSYCVFCPLCVCLPHFSSPLLLSMSLTVQISSTPLNDYTHDDDDVPSAVRPVGACPVLLLVRVRDSDR
ncbi:mucin TcMUCII, putative [Trypanosoma cruzi marinkellei]|uniref:Mucin TcMUCII, putative n=1 Tax=Trypanosoma cruzi marinkellei TaxID=85056 RepID=K2MQK5_TRYCR|nr:mucin TcMUCII, putative [Trypanosoma cruzi marinkellei]